jgi:hypothetical protein
MAFSKKIIKKVEYTNDAAADSSQFRFILNAKSGRQEQFRLLTQLKSRINEIKVVKKKDKNNNNNNNNNNNKETHAREGLLKDVVSASVVEADIASVAVNEKSVEFSNNNNNNKNARDSKNNSLAQMPDASGLQQQRTLVDNDEQCSFTSEETVDLINDACKFLNENENETIRDRAENQSLLSSSVFFSRRRKSTLVSAVTTNATATTATITTNNNNTRSSFAGACNIVFLVSFFLSLSLIYIAVYCISSILRASIFLLIFFSFIRL